MTLVDYSSQMEIACWFKHEGILNIEDQFKGIQWVCMVFTYLFVELLTNYFIYVVVNKKIRKSGMPSTFFHKVAM